IWTDRPAEPALADALVRRTEGNPLFLIETLRWLADEDRAAEGELPAPGPGSLPPTVREVIGRRLAHLSPAAGRLLTIAAVIGRDFRLDILAEADSAEASGVHQRLEWLAEAEIARLIAPLPDTPGHYRFTHGLIQQTLYYELPSAERLRWHQRVAEALERCHA